MPKEPDGMVCVGAIAGAFGVHGEARVKSFCAVPESIADYGPLATEAGGSYGVKITRPVKDGFAARLTGVATREQAESLKGTRLYAPRDRLPALDDDEYYHADLIGLEVVDTGGAVLGKVRAIHDFGAGDVLDVLGQGKEHAFPFTRAAVPTIDVAQGRIVVDLSEVEGASEADQADG